MKTVVSIVFRGVLNRVEYIQAVRHLTQIWANKAKKKLSRHGYLKQMVIYGLPKIHPMHVKGLL